jgi:amino acid transporter
MCIAWGFWVWGTAIPRSGGIYAFVSRGVNPALGFALSFVDTLTWLFYNALAATFLTSIGIAPALFIIGVSTGNQYLIHLAFRIQAPTVEFVIGAIGIVVAGAVLIRGMKTFFYLQRILFILALIGTGATIFVLSRTTPADFQASISNAFAPYAGSAAGSLHEAPPLWVMSWKMTVLASVWPILSFVGSIFSVNIGGEIRNVKKSQAIGMFGSIIVSAVLMMLISILADGAFGRSYQASLGSLGSSGALPLPPYLSLLTGLAAKNLAVGVVVAAGFFCWAFFWIPATLVYAARSVLAWSFDRVAPAALGYVHPRWHTPVSAVILVVAANLVFLGLFLFYPFFGTLVLVLAAMLAWIPTMLGAILFPFRRKELFDGCPLAASRILGMPLMSVAGTAGLIATLVLAVMLWNDPVAAGHSAQSLITIAVLFSVGLALYWLAYFVRKRQGIQIDRAFKEIPIE